MNPKPPKRSFLVDTIRKIILLGISVGLIYWFFAPDQRNSFHPVTMADLRGVWTTTHPQYRDRFLQFDDETITFGWGNAGAGTYTVDGLESEPAGDGALVHVRYIDLAQTDFQLSFHCVFQNGGRIQMKNQKMVWFRTSIEPTYSPIFK
jgi:hypothetical protein